MRGQMIMALVLVILFLMAVIAVHQARQPSDGGLVLDFIQTIRYLWYFFIGSRIRVWKYNRAINRAQEKFHDQA